jgi:hypothetical protein
MPFVLVEKGEPVHHPLIQAVGGVLGHLAHDVRALLQPTQLAARRRRKDVDLTVLAAIAVTGYDGAAGFVSRCSVVW